MLVDFVLLFIFLIVLCFSLWIVWLQLEVIQFVTVSICLFLAVYYGFILPNAGPFIMSWRKEMQIMESLVPDDKKLKIYELWCWYGSLLRSLYDKWYKDCTWIDVSYVLILYSKVINYFTKRKITFICANIWSYDYYDADVIIVYLLPSAMKRIEKDHWSKLKKWTVLISNAFKFPNIKEVNKVSNVYTYIK